MMIKHIKENISTNQLLRNHKLIYDLEHFLPVNSVKRFLKIIPNGGQNAEKHAFSHISKEKENKWSQQFGKAL